MKVLFICTHNRCRSILAEAIANHLGGNSLEARSAGSSPVGEVHPLSIKYLQQRNISTEGLCSQSWDAHESFAPDIVFTVCDSAAKETCPVWFDNSTVIHWGLPDPSKLRGSDDEMEQAFMQVMDTLETRITALLSLNTKVLDSQQRLQAIQKLAES